MKIKRILPTALMTLSIIAVPPLFLTACDQDGPAEQIGENVDEAINDTKRAVQDAAD